MSQRTMQYLSMSRWKTSIIKESGDTILSPEPRNITAIERIIQMLKFIAYEPKVWTARKLADSFHTSIRTIYRDIAKLESMGISVYSETDGGYFITDPQARIPVVSSSKDQLLLTLMPGLLHELANHSSNSVERLLIYALHRSGLYTENRENLTKYIHWHSPLGIKDHPLISQHLASILDGIMNQTTLKIEYTAIKDSAPSTILFDPYHLMFRPKGPYVFGYYHERSGFRTLKVIRMSSVILTNEKFTRNETASEAWNSSTAFGIDFSGDVIDATLHVDPHIERYVREDLQSTGLAWYENREEQQMIVHVRVRNNPEWMRWILQFGPDIEVIAPKSLRDQVMEKIRQSFARYDSLEM